MPYTKLTMAGISDNAMAISQDHANWSEGSGIMDHAGNHGSPFVSIESAAWGYQDPLEGWYDAEKKIYDAGPDANGQYSGVIGHYLHCIDADGAENFNAGAAMTSGLTSTMNYVTDTGALGQPRVSVADYSADFESYYRKVTGSADVTSLEDQLSAAERELAWMS